MQQVTPTRSEGDESSAELATTLHQIIQSCLDDNDRARPSSGSIIDHLRPNVGTRDAPTLVSGVLSKLSTVSTKGLSKQQVRRVKAEVATYAELCQRCLESGSVPSQDTLLSFYSYVEDSRSVSPSKLKVIQQLLPLLQPHWESLSRNEGIVSSSSELDVDLDDLSPTRMSETLLDSGSETEDYVENMAITRMQARNQVERELAESTGGLVASLSEKVAARQLAWVKEIAAYHEQELERQEREPATQHAQWKRIRDDQDSEATSASDSPNGSIAGHNQRRGCSSHPDLVPDRAGLDLSMLHPQSQNASHSPVEQTSAQEQILPLNARPLGLGSSTIPSKYMAGAPIPGHRADELPSNSPSVATRKRKPAHLTLDTWLDTPWRREPTPGMQSIKSSRFLEIAEQPKYPDGTNPPNPVLAGGRKSHVYDKRFLLQFRHVSKELPSVDWDQKMTNMFGLMGEYGEA